VPVQQKVMEFLQTIPQYPPPEKGRASMRPTSTTRHSRRLELSNVSRTSNPSVRRRI